MTTETAATSTLDDRSAVGGPDLPQERRLVTEIPGPRSRELQERRTAAVASGVGSVLPVYVAAAGGGVIVDVDGNSLIDLGQRHRRGQRRQQRARGGATRHRPGGGVHAHLLHGRAVRGLRGGLRGARRGSRPATTRRRPPSSTPAPRRSRTPSRSPARTPGATRWSAFDHAYHGRTNLTMAMTSKNMPYKHGFGPFAGEVYRAPMSYPFREASELTGEQAAARAIDVIEKQVGADNLACVVIEPVLGEGGFVVPAPGFLPALAQWCTDNGVVFVADEIQSGMCRTGAWFACEHEGVVPDLVTVAKGMAGGLPLAGVVGRAEIMDAVHGGGLGGTYGGNPVTCAAALGAIATMEQLDLNAAAREIEQTMTARLRALAEKVPAIGDVRGRGAMIAVELVEPGTNEARRRAGRQDQRRLPPGRRAHADLRHLRQRAPLPAAARDPRATCSTRRST